jgi:hypothetical protein
MWRYRLTPRRSTERISGAARSGIPLDALFAVQAHLQSLKLIKPTNGFSIRPAEVKV